MSTWKIIGGVIIGVGAVAAAPFTGGGSLLGGASLVASLTGAAGIATAAGVAGGVAGAAISEEEKKRNKKRDENHFQEGAKASEAKIKEKVLEILSTQKKRDEFMLLTVKIGTHVAKCDGEFAPEEKKEIENFKGEVNASPFVPEIIRNHINDIIESDVTFQDIVDSTKQFLQNESDYIKDESLRFFDRLIQAVVYADGIKHNNEEEFIIKWNKEFAIYG